VRDYPGQLHEERPEPHLDVSVGQHPDGYVEVVAAGEIDFATHRALLGRLAAEIERGHSRILLDLSSVTFCDSTGIGMLVRIFRQAAQRGGWLRLAGPVPAVRRVLEITNLDRMIPVFDSVTDARKAP
jgi:anti-sigma B factor antagonist